MDSTKNNKMITADPESGAGSDLKKDTSWFSFGSPKKVVLLIISALLAGMIIATVIIFATGLHLNKAPEEVSTHHKTHHTGEKHNNEQINELMEGTDTPNDDDVEGDGAEKQAKNYGYWWVNDGTTDEPYPADMAYYNTYMPDEPEDPESPANPNPNPNPEQPANPDMPEDPADPEEPTKPNPNPNPNPEQPANPAITSWEELQTQLCGQSSLTEGARIVNGVDVTDDKVWPWAVYLSDSQGFFCGASLISPQWVITAAHCVERASANQLTITFGRLNQQVSSSNELQRTVTKIISHPSYDSAAINNDIALLKLNSPVPFSDTVRPVCVNSDDNEHIPYGAVDACWVVGWGATSSGGSTSNILQQVQSPLVNKQDCQNKYRPTGNTITEQMICTSTDRASGSCQGDSGGPMVCHHVNRFYLVGVTSWGIGCADRNHPDVMARVSQFKDFIKDNIVREGL